MSSKLDLPLQIRTLLLILLLFGAGASLPLNAIRDFAEHRNQGVTGLFLSLLVDLLQRPKILNNLFQHANASSSILKYFEATPNALDSYFWLQNKPALFNLLSDGDTLNALGEAPWLFHLIRVINQTYPRQYGIMLQNRTIFNVILSQVAVHNELRSLLTYHPEYFPLIFNLTSTNPRAGAWLRILSPPTLSTLPEAQQITVTVFILSLKPVQQMTVQLANATSIIDTYSAAASLVFNATLNIRGLPNDIYTIEAILTLTNGSTFSDAVLIYQQTTAVQTANKQRTTT